PDTELAQPRPPVPGPDVIDGPGSTPATAKALNAAAPAASHVRVEARVLGRPTLITVGAPKQDLRRRALELLVYLVVHRRGANLTDIKEAFWPDATDRRAGERLQTEAGDLRARIRDAYWAANPDLDPGEDKRPPIDSVVNTGGRYHLNPD